MSSDHGDGRQDQARPARPDSPSLDRHRWPAGLRLLAFALVVVTTVGLAVAAVRYAATRPITASPPATPLTGPARLADLAGPAGAPGPGGRADRRTLVLYRETGPRAELSREYAIRAANLASRGGSWELRPIERYAAGDLDRYQAMIHIGAGDEAIPRALVDDVLDSAARVLWMGFGIEQLFAAEPSPAERLGWSLAGYEQAEVTGVEYGGRLLPRRADPGDTMARIAVGDDQVATVLGVARRADGTTSPWAVRSGNLTYIGEIPFAYAEPGDRYLAAADVVLQTVAPDAPRRKRALVRIEDVGPNSDPDDITATADLLHERRIPFTVAVYPYYRDPNGSANRGRPTEHRLTDRPELVEALRHARAKGATLIMHGYTHQHDTAHNPYSGTSAEDFEFYGARLDDRNNVVLDGPVAGDSKSWASERMSVGRGEFVRVGLPDPDIFEFPHYTASEASYRAAHDMFGVRYDQGSYFTGMCQGGDCAAPSAPGRMFQQYFPYPVRDVYGSVVVPENLWSVTHAFNNNPAHTAADVVANAEALTVVGDAVASTFYHPYLGVEGLAQVVDGIAALGYQFVSPYDVIEAPAPAP